MTPRLHVKSQGPLAVFATVFRDNHGTYVGTVVAKITYSLGPGTVPPLDEPIPIQEADGHWDDDPARSVHIPSDVAPFKKSPEVVVVGSAFAPGDRPAPSVIARVIVGSVDKSVEVHGPRFVRDGAIEETQRARRFPLRYEYAAGGQDSDNPMGIDIARADVRGRRPVPQILPIAYEVSPHATHLPTIGLGPLPTVFRTRSEELRHVDRAWLDDHGADPLPMGFPSNYFQSAPPDQWLSRPLAANERIVLENLHQRHPRLVMTLPGLEPVAVIVGQPEPLRLRADLLVIDSDQGLCTLTFRGHLSLAENRALTQAAVTLVPMGSMFAPEQLRTILQSITAEETIDDEDLEVDEEAMGQTRDISPGALTTAQSMLAASGLPFSGSAAKSTGQNQRRGTITTVTNVRQEAPVVHRQDKPFPFAHPASVPARQPSYSDGLLAAPPIPPATIPMVAKPPASIPAAPVSSPAMQSPPLPPPVLPSRHVSYADGMLAPPSNSSSAVPPPMMNAGRVLGTPNSGPAVSLSSLPTGAIESKPRAEVPSIAPPVETNKSGSLMFGLRARDPNAPVSRPNEGQGTSGNGLTVQSLSDAAAHEEKPFDGRNGSSKREMPLRQQTPAARRLAVIDLLTFEPKIAPRLRSMKRLASLWQSLPKTKSQLSPDEPQRSPPDPDREIVLRVLSYAEGQTPADIRRTFAESLEDHTDLDPPLVFCAGELQPKFDEMETLKVSISVANSVAGTDKRMLGAIAVAQEAAAASLPPAPETLKNLTKQIETASISLNLPPRFLVNHVERILVENRHYKRRMILGAQRVRADLVFAGGEVMPMYLLDDAAKSLPLLPSFPVMTVCEIRPREDLAEQQSEALLCVALGRVLHGRSGQ